MDIGRTWQLRLPIELARRGVGHGSQDNEGIAHYRHHRKGVATSNVEGVVARDAQLRVYNHAPNHPCSCPLILIVTIFCQQSLARIYQSLSFKRELLYLSLIGQQ